jgi:hypothetical protein
MREVVIATATAASGIVGRYLPSSPVLRRRVLFAGIAFGAFASLIYFNWWADHIRPHGCWLLAGIILTQGYIVAQIYAVWHLYLHIATPASLSALAGRTVDVLVPVYDEPYELVEHYCWRPCEAVPH